MKEQKRKWFLKKEQITAKNNNTSNESNNINSILEKLEESELPNTKNKRPLTDRVTEKKSRPSLSLYFDMPTPQSESNDSIFKSPSPLYPKPNETKKESPSPSPHKKPSDHSLLSRRSLLSRLSKDGDEEFSSKRSWVLRRDEINRNKVRKHSVILQKRFEKIQRGDYLDFFPLVVQNVNGYSITVMIKKSFTIKKVSEEIDKLHKKYFIPDGFCVNDVYIAGVKLNPDAKIRHYPILECVGHTFFECRKLLITTKVSKNSNFSFDVEMAHYLKHTPYI